MIDAKIVDQNGNVRTVQLQDIPKDVELIAALGGTVGQHDIHWYGTIMGWDIIYLNGQTDKMVIGSASYVGQPERPRASCRLTDEQVNNLVNFFTNGWNTLNLWN